MITKIIPKESIRVPSEDPADLIWASFSEISDNRAD